MAKETVFDHNLTEDEFEYFFSIGDIKVLTKEEAIKWVEKKSQDENYSDIAELYSLRMDKKKMDEYIGKIKDPYLQQDTAHTVYHTYYELLSEQRLRQQTP